AQHYLALAHSGFDAISPGSEHSLEQGLASLIEAKRLSEQADLQTFGAYRDSIEKLLYELELVREDKMHVEHRLGVLSYILDHTEDAAASSTEDERDFAVRTYDPETVKDDAAKMRGEGAVIVMAMIPIDMNETDPMRAIEEYARDLTDVRADVDVIIGVQGAMVYGMSKTAGNAAVYPEIRSAYRYIRPVEEMRDWEPRVETDGVVLHLYVKVEDGTISDGYYWPLITSELI
ncbi:MAG: CapA family protein, partial [Oscillospiraceae bacterium]|nr:CapA family protein [Oscillospiraceae bacterium]